MPMNRNVKSNRVSEDWTATFLQSVLRVIPPQFWFFTFNCEVKLPDDSIFAPF